MSGAPRPMAVVLSVTALFLLYKVVAGDNPMRPKPPARAHLADLWAAGSYQQFHDKLEVRCHGCPHSPDNAVYTKVSPQPQLGLWAADCKCASVSDASLRCADTTGTLSPGRPKGQAGRHGGAGAGRATTADARDLAHPGERAAMSDESCNSAPFSRLLLTHQRSRVRVQYEADYYGGPLMAAIAPSLPFGQVPALIEWEPGQLHLTGQGAVVRALADRTGMGGHCRCPRVHLPTPSPLSLSGRLQKVGRRMQQVTDLGRSAGGVGPLEKAAVDMVFEGVRSLMIAGGSRPSQQP